MNNTQQQQQQQHHTVISFGLKDLNTDCQHKLCLPFIHVSILVALSLWLNIFRHFFCCRAIMFLFFCFSFYFFSFTLLFPCLFHLYSSSGRFRLSHKFQTNTSVTIWVTTSLLYVVRHWKAVLLPFFCNCLASWVTVAAA